MGRQDGVGDLRGFGNFSPSGEVDCDRLMRVIVYWMGDATLPKDQCEQLFFNSLMCIHKHIVHYESDHCLLKPAALLTRTPNLTEISICGSTGFSAWFVEPEPGGTPAYWELLPSLKYLSLTFGPTHDGDDWSPLIPFLSCRAKVGNRLESLKVRWCSHMCRDVVEEIESVVQQFEVDSEDSVCPHGKCLAPWVKQSTCFVYWVTLHEYIG